MGNVIRRPIFSHVKPYIDKLINYRNHALFPGQELDKSIDTSSSNLYMRKLRDNIDIPEWRTHDFRRSLVTTLSSEGIIPHVTEKMVGHVLGRVDGCVY
ncbi:hypothetical protein ARSQ2_00737 [Arsenophonus endosymbiont of Bemisia tabaci Q2]|nr:hypothetical protein ARSQ2_00737 [Arsenophonus endosymbiont of Bemisia tabaci Q2]